MNDQNPQPHDHDAGHDHDHAHDHGHHHEHGGHAHDDPFHPKLGVRIDTSEFDPANRSLAEALRLSFGIMSVVMLVLVGAYVVSGIYKVDEGEVAVRLQFGKALGPTLGQAEIRRPGGPYWAWPRPLDQVLFIPTSIRQVNIEDAFWMKLERGDQGKPPAQLPVKNQLQPGDDGSLITGDQNIVHGKWAISYQVDPDQVDQFIRNVSASTERDAMMNEADARVQHAAERAILHVVATMTAEDVVRGATHISGEVRRTTQETLDRLDAGLTVVSVSNVAIMPPTAVRDAFEEVARAFSEQERLRQNARQEATRILQSAAGPAHEALALAIEYYEVARRTGDEAAIDRGEQIIAALLDGVTAATALKPLAEDPDVPARKLASASAGGELGGRASELLSQAIAFKKGSEEEVRGEAARFQQIYEQYRGNKATYVALRWWGEAMQHLLDSDVEVWTAPQGVALWLELNRDPRYEESIQEERLRRQSEEERQRKAGGGGRR